MTAGLDAPKSNPSDIAKIAIDGIAAGSFEILADDTSRMIQAGLAGGVSASTRICPNPSAIKVRNMELPRRLAMAPINRMLSSLHMETLLFYCLGSYYDSYTSRTED